VVICLERGADCLHTVQLMPHVHVRLTALAVSQYQKGKTNLEFAEARDSEWQWHQLGHMQVCTELQRDNHVSTTALSFLQAGYPTCCPTNSVKALKALSTIELMPLHPKTPSSVASLKLRRVFPFWYWLSQFVLEKRPLNGCVLVCVWSSAGLLGEGHCCLCAHTFKPVIYLSYVVCL